MCWPALGMLVAQPSQIVYKYSDVRPQIGQPSACQLRAIMPGPGELDLSHGQHSEEVRPPPPVRPMKIL